MNNEIVTMDEMIRTAAETHEVPLELLSELIELERDKITLLNRRLSPRIVELIAKRTESESAPSEAEE